mmetsp:Transcript_15889/g.31630  ORF Transcript_15889/g.31630 Transcript_15889/m.31630 type:complete len:83 (+) Transcript_15889:1410-1658(+)
MDDENEALIRSVACGTAGGMRRGSGGDDGGEPVEGSGGTSDESYEVVEREALNGDADVHERLRTALAEVEALKKEVARMKRP